MIKNPRVAVALIVSVGVVLAAYFLGSSFKNRNENLDSISVVGLGKKDFVSDQILWQSSFNTRSEDIKGAYSKILADQKVISDFFVSKGFKTTEFSFGKVSFNKRFREVRIENPTDRYGTAYESIFDGYEASQTILFQAKKNPELMQRIEQVASKTADLVNFGIELNSNRIQYTYSDLPSLKHSLIESGTTDAYERASKIVNKADGSLGKLKSANMGVFQITGQGSTEEDSYGGNFDVYSKNKSARITVRLVYQLN